MKLKFTLLLSMVLIAFSAQSQSVLGKWETIDDATGDAKSIVEITERDGKIYGKVVQILNPAMKDLKCKDCSGDDKDKPVLGIEVIKGLKKDGDKYSDGKILDPSSGKLYKCTVSFDGADKLKVRGYVGISAFGRNQIWHRVK